MTAGANTTIGVLGGYPGDFARLDRPPAGIRLAYIERDTAKLRLPPTLDAILVVTRFVNHRHWKQLRASGIPLITVQGGWTSVNRAVKVLAKQQGRIDKS